ncbi:Bud site selection protein, Revert to axial protein 1 [Maudiozyma exigua]|uniref:Bud site selection protein, Revert to axial protein 1 n=1 Tax=Maudiozyma exigua TaxID=34358 RepID=A0A9P6WAG3_MAUEX|nr:Bud site selection protein, Revert to axial protein 1 [Kazachstania exigua]
MESDFIKVQKERLPTLYEVLIQKTVTPVDLWSFYTYLSQFPYAINYLDFWIDLMAHIRLCRDYMRLVRESAILERHTDNNNEKVGHTSDNNNEENGNTSDDTNSDEDDNRSVTTSVLLNALLEDGRIDLENHRAREEFQQHTNNDNNYSPKIADLIEGWKRHSGTQNEALNIDNPNLAILMDEVLKKHPEGLPLPHVTADELRSNADHIIRTYLLSIQNSKRYLSNVPEEIRNDIIREVMENKKFTPEIFDPLKTLTYQFLEIDCFPKFLSRVALHNIHDEISDWRFHQDDVYDNYTPGKKRLPHRTNKDNNINSVTYQGSKSPFSNYTSLSRTILGMLWLGIGFWIGYVLIFLKYSRAIRVITVVPFTIGCYMIICGMYEVDIIYSWFGITQRLMYKDNDFDNLNNKSNGNTTDAVDLEQGRSQSSKNVPYLFALLGGRGRLLRIEHPFVRTLLFKRGLWCCLLVFISTACFTIIFSCVPGYRI